MRRASFVASLLFLAACMGPTEEEPVLVEPAPAFEGDIDSLLN